ncbi:MAG: hypothetical protein JWN48_141 [Myxococcaceae bacterium]|nr:hypothetical protein [Myxococcaceae bacterium]
MKRGTESGYTLIEIMISVVIMTIGAAGILAMQGATVRSNQDANETATAINFATTWMERIKRDARMWNDIGATDLAASSLYVSNAITNNGVWVVPAAVAPDSAAADYFGFDTPITGGTATTVRYCVNARFTQAHVMPAGLDAVRVDLLVWWKRSSSSDATASTATCATPLTAAQIASTTADGQTLRKHFLSTIVRWREPTVWPP